MDPKTRLRRHAKLWESGTAGVQRLAFTAMIFAVVVLLNVIQPHWKIEKNPEVVQLRLDVTELKEQQSTNEKEIAQLEKIAHTLDQIEVKLRGEPWKDNIEELVKFCAGNCPSNTKPVASKVIKEIATELQTLIVHRLRTTITETNLTEEFGDQATAIESAINKWRDEKLKTVWWNDLASKAAAAGEAGEFVRTSAMEAERKLESLGSAATKAVENTATVLSQKQTELDDEEKGFDELIKKKDAKIEVAMAAALPSWARGLMTPDRMVTWYPWILASLIVFMLFNAWMAGHHFRGMADEEGWSAEERRDPLLSSPWTLTHRGTTGSAVTALHYAAVFGILLYCIAQSFKAAAG